MGIIKRWRKSVRSFRIVEFREKGGNRRDSKNVFVEGGDVKTYCGYALVQD